MNQDEVISIGEIFMIYPTEEYFDIFQKIGIKTEEFVHLSDIQKLVKELKQQNKSIFENPQIIDNIIVSRLEIPNTIIFDVLIKIARNLNNEIQKNHTPQQQKFLEESQTIVNNYFGLAISTPEIFSQCNFKINAEQYSSYVDKQVSQFLQISTMIQSHKTILQMYENLHEIKPNLFDIIKNAIMMESYNKMTIYNNQWDQILSLIQILLEINQFKTSMLKDTQSINKLNNGKEIEQQTLFGYLLYFSMIPNQDDNRMKSFNEQIVQKIKSFVNRKNKEKILQITKKLMKKYENGLDGNGIIMSFFEYCLKLNVDKLKFGIQFNKKIQHKISSDSFGIGICDLLMELTKPIIFNDKLIQKIDFDFQYQMNTILQEQNHNYFSAIPDIDENIENYKKNKDYGTVSKFYFYFFESLRYFYIPHINNLERMSQSIQHLKKRVSKNSVEQKLLQQYIENLENQFLISKLFFEDLEYNKNLNKFFETYFNHILILKNKVIIPEQYLNIYNKYQTFMTNLHKKYFNILGNDNFKKYFDVLELFLSQDFKNSKQHVKASFLDLLFTLNMIQKGQLVSIIEGYLSNSQNLKRFVSQILTAFSDAESMSDHNQSGTNKYRFRFFIAKFLNEALIKETYVEAFKQITKDKEAHNFLGHLITDLNFFLEDVFEKLKQVKILESQQTTIQQNTDMQHEVEQNPQLLKDQVKQNLQFGRTYFLLFENIASIDYRFFENEQWIQKVANVINFYADKMSTKSYKEYKFSGINELGLKPLQFITSLVNIYFFLSHSQKIKEEIAGDQRSYSKEVLLDIGVTAFKKNLVQQQVLNEYEKLIFELDQLREEIIIYETITKDCPDKFLCGMTAEIMKDPVLLPNSKFVVDLSSIKQQIILNGPIDPYTRQPLNIEDVQEMSGLKQEIENWLSEKKEKIKQEIQKQRKNNQGIKDTKQEDHYQEEIQQNTQDDFTQLNRF